jgi:hypothetical protein
MIEIKNRRTGAVLLRLSRGALRDEDLTLAQLDGADLTGANLRGARLQGCCWSIPTWTARTCGEQTFAAPVSSRRDWSARTCEARIFAVPS